jgi:hypothetical protein
MIFRGGEFSTGEMGIFHPALTEASPEGDLYVRSGPGTVRLSPESAREYIRTRFPLWSPHANGMQ